MGAFGEVGAHTSVSFSWAALLAAFAYLLGAVPFALILGLWKGVDIRKVGSGNIGSTNLSRVLGRKWGIPAFLLDFLKGLIPVLIAGWLPESEPGARRVAAEHAAMAAALAAVLGHIFPVYLQLRGGKGVATAFGALTGLVWPASLAAGAVWGALFLATRTVSIASLAAACTFPLGTILYFRTAPSAVAVPMDLLSAAVCALIVARHRSNIRRLLRGEEGRF